jgi:hypothetical protein
MGAELLLFKTQRHSTVLTGQAIRSFEATNAPNLAYVLLCSHILLESAGIVCQPSPFQTRSWTLYH